jgi:hypothetical protein
MTMRGVLALVFLSTACGRLGFTERGDDTDALSGDANVTVDASPIDPFNDWADPSFQLRYRLTITNPLTTVRPRTPVFVDGTALTGGTGPIRESSTRLVCKVGSTNLDTPFALHDWTSDPLPVLGDPDGDLDANDRLLFLVDLPASGAVDCSLYYDVVDRAPPSLPVVAVAPVGTGTFTRVIVDGTTTNAAALRVTDGVATFDLELEPSIPLFNQGSYTYPSSALGPRIDNLKLPDGTMAMATVNHAGPPTGNLSHTIRLGPSRHDGPFSLLGNNAFYQAHLVDAIAHSAVHAWSRPIASVIVLDTELYCEGTPCVPARDAGDVRLVGYVFDRGDNNEVLMRWQVDATVNGTSTIASYTPTSEPENFSLVSYILEEYAEATFPALIDIDTVRGEDGSGTITSNTFNPGHTGGDSRANSTIKWMMMTDTDAPYTGSVAIIPEGVPRLNGANATWRAGYWDDGKTITEPNGFQSEWNLYASGFDTWGSTAGHTGSWSYWIAALPHPAAGNDYAPAQDMRAGIASAPTLAPASFEMQ